MKCKGLLGYLKVCEARPVFCFQITSFIRSEKSSQMNREKNVGRPRHPEERRMVLSSCPSSSLLSYA